MRFKLPPLFLCALSMSSIWGQTSSNSGGSTTSGTRWTFGTQPTVTLNVKGTVKMDDGSPLPGSANIVVACGGATRTVTYTSLLDDFGFQLTASRETGPLGASSAFNSAGSAIGGASGGTPTAGHTQGDCELRAELSGYTSSSINLSNPMSFEGSDVGVIWLHRSSDTHTGSMISVSTLRAPKEAKKNFDKGVGFLHSEHLEEASKSFGEAVRIDPNFAEAWLNLGSVQYRLHLNDAAKDSLQKAMALDPRMPGVWQIMGYMASDREDWPAVIRDLDQAERLDPRGSSLTWFVSAVAYYRMNRYAEAERSIREEMKLDAHLQYPRSQYLLGLILIARNDIDGGTAALRNYLAATPDPRDIATAKAVLTQTSVIASK